MLFSIDNPFIVKDADFLKEFGTLYDLLIYLLDNSKRILTSAEDQIKFLKNNIISKDEKFYDAPKKSKKSISEKSEKESDQSISKWVQVTKDRFDFIKLKINENKDVGTIINNKKYTLNDLNKLVNKIAEKKFVKIMPLQNTMTWQIKQSKSQN